MRVIKVIVLVVVVEVLAAAAGIIWLLKSRGLGTHGTPGVLETYLARQARRIATDPAVRSRRNPLPATPLAVAEGRDHFADHCAICHGNDGSGMTDAGTGLYPPAPDMRQRDTQQLSDGELFDIIKNGVRFTGMPGWGGEDNENWELVLFVRHLPQLTPKEIELMKEINHASE